MTTSEQIADAWGFALCRICGAVLRFRCHDETRTQVINPCRHVLEAHKEANRG